MRETLETPIGPVVLVARADGLSRCGRRRGGPEDAAARDASPAARRHLRDALAALRGYFAGTRRDFRDLVLAPTGSPFQQAVWRELRQVPWGVTTSYGALAARLGEVGRARAVGAASGANPLLLVQPCHRVVGGDGRLVGFAGGLSRKAWLLRHEGMAIVGPPAQPRIRSATPPASQASEARASTPSSRSIQLALLP